MKVLVYDGQVGYYKLLREIVEYEAVHYKGDPEHIIDYDVLVFFLQDELELLDFVKLYKKDKLVLFIAAQRNNSNYPCDTNICFIEIEQPVASLLEEIKEKLSTTMKQ